MQSGAHFACLSVLTHCGLNCCHMTQSGANIGILPGSTKPLHEPMLIIISKVQWHSSEDNLTRIPQPSVTRMKITNPKFNANLQGPNELSLGERSIIHAINKCHQCNTAHIQSHSGHFCWHLYLYMRGYSSHDKMVETLVHCGLVTQWTCVQVMTYCLMAPNLYLNQCWLTISEVLLYSPEVTFICSALALYPWYEFENG